MTNLLEYALSLEGIKEDKIGDNPKILQMYKDAGAVGIKHDETAWCAAFVGHCLKVCGFENSGSLMAKSYVKYGQGVAFKDMQPGDILVWNRGKDLRFGHVEFLVKKKGAFVEVVGGNVNDAVRRYTRKITTDLVAIRRPIKQALKLDKPITSKPIETVKKPSKIPDMIVATIMAAIGALLYYFKG